MNYLQIIQNHNLYPKIRDRVLKNQNMILFVGGFLFDVFTLKRIDSWVDLIIQMAYLAGLTFVLIFQYKESKKAWLPQKWFQKIWPYNISILHFFYGGLLSNYVVLYSKSSSGIRPFVFFGLLVILFIINEIPQIKKVGYRLRLGLYSFCLASFLIYFIPILLGKMGDWVFILSLSLTCLTVWQVTKALSAQEDLSQQRSRRIQLFLPAALVLIIISSLYFFRLVPPVPLSVKFDGVFHKIEKTPQGYHLKALRPPFYLFWRRDSRPFRARPEDRIYYFTRIFAPSRFKHRVMIHWEFYNESKQVYVSNDRIPLSIHGGREQGFRGFAVKSHFQPGRWRVTLETEDGRIIGRRSFHIIQDKSHRERKWIDLFM